MAEGDNMLERCAKAILAKVPAGYGMTATEAVEYARAVIEEMRRPTNRMLKAAAKAMSPEKRPTPTWVSGSAKHGIRYRAMIDTALHDNRSMPLRIPSQANEGHGNDPNDCA